MCSPILHVGPCARNLKPPGRYFLPYVLILKAVNKQILNPKCWSCPSALHLKGPTGMIPSIIAMATGGGIIRRGCFSFQCCPVQQHMARRQERTGMAWRKEGKGSAQQLPLPQLHPSPPSPLPHIKYWTEYFTDLLKYDERLFPFLTEDTALQFCNVFQYLL